MPNPNNPVFPDNVATDSDLMVATNRALSKLINPINASQTQITVTDGTKFEVPCLVQIDTEIVKVESKSGNDLLSCTRGYALTSPASHGQNADVKGYVLSYHHNQLAAEIKAIEAGLGASFGNVVLRSDEDAGSSFNPQDIGGHWTNLHLMNNGVTAGTYGGFNKNVLLSVDATGRVTDIENALGNINYPIIYKAAIVQGSNCVLGFSFAGTMGVDAPNAVEYSGGSGLLYAVAQFTGGNDYWVQDHFYLPDDWPGTGASGSQGIVSLDVYWRSPATAGTVTWGVRVAGMRDGNGPDLTWNSWKFATTTVPGSANKTVKTRITPLYMNGIQAGDELFFEFVRASKLPGDGGLGPGDTAGNNPVTGPATEVAELVSIKFNLNRDFALVQ